TTKTVMPNTQNAGPTLQPATGAPTTGSLSLMDGSAYNQQGQQTQAPQFSPEQLHSAMSVALAAQPAQQPQQQPPLLPPQQQPPPPPPSNLYPPGYDPAAMKGLESSVQQYSQLSPEEIKA